MVRAVPWKVWLHHGPQSRSLIPSSVPVRRPRSSRDFTTYTPGVPAVSCDPFHDPSILFFVYSIPSRAPSNTPVVRMLFSPVFSRTRSLRSLA